MPLMLRRWWRSPLHPACGAVAIVAPPAAPMVGTFMRVTAAAAAAVAAAAAGSSNSNGNSSGQAVATIVPSVATAAAPAGEAFSHRAPVVVSTIFGPVPHVTLHMLARANTATNIKPDAIPYIHIVY